MNKKQFFLLSLLVCPLSYQQNAHAGYLRSFLTGTVISAASYACAIVLIGKSNQARSENRKTEHEKTHPFEAAKETLDGLIVSEAVQALEMAQTFIKKHTPFTPESTTPSGEKTTTVSTASTSHDDTATLESSAGSETTK